MSREERLVETSKAVRDAESQLERARGARDEAIRAAIDAGMTAYRVAQVAGLSQPAVAAARDRAGVRPGPAGRLGL